MPEDGAPFRGFVAVMLPTAVQEEVGGLIDRLRCREVRWTAAEKLHLTLKFLGQVSPSRLPALLDGLRGAVAVPPFTCELAGLGAFPKLERPQVVWVGVRRGQEELAELAARVDGAAHRAGFAPEERPFRAHLTLGRTRPDADSSGLRELTERLRGVAAGPFSPIPVNAVHLVESTLTPRGPIYSLKEPFTLGGSLG